MKKTKHTEEQIIGAVKQLEAGRPVKDRLDNWASRIRRSINGDRSTAAWRYRDKHGRIMVTICHNMHLGDAWEHGDEPEYPEKFSGLAFRIVLNHASLDPSFRSHDQSVLQGDIRFRLQYFAECIRQRAVNSQTTRL